MKIVIIDPKCPYPYDCNTLLEKGLGGTEATVIRVSQSLATRHEVCVVQHNRENDAEYGDRFRFVGKSKTTEECANADHVIFIQKSQDIDIVSNNTRAKLWLWLHNYVGDEVPIFLFDHIRYPLQVICVSRVHAEHTAGKFRDKWYARLAFRFLGRNRIFYVYNPVDEELVVKDGPRDNNKLVFFSSPYKGIEDVLGLFKKAYNKCSELRLYVADPGYMKNSDEASLVHPGIIQLGTLPHHVVIEHLRNALCVFYPQKKRPETFGLVYAEANAVGTPVLAHDFGAASEVLSANNPPLDISDENSVIELLMKWREFGAPAVDLDEKFRIASVSESWVSLLSDADSFKQMVCIN